MSPEYKHLQPTLDALAPHIAAGINGPLNGLATSALGAALGVTTREEVQAALFNITPEVANALRLADKKFGEDMHSMGVDLDKISFNGRSDERRRRALKERVPSILAAMVTIGFFSQFALLAWHGIPPENKEALFILLGNLAAGFIMILQYHFTRKDDKPPEPTKEPE